MACHIGFRCVRGTFGTLVKHLMYFRDPDGRFESLGIQTELRYKFRDLGYNLLFMILLSYYCTSSYKNMLNYCFLRSNL